MSIDRTTAPHRDRASDAQRLAAAARSILACPADVQLVVDGVDDVTAGPAGEHLAMQDRRGTPLFTCPRDSVLAVAAAEQRPALLTLRSGLGPGGGSDRTATLTLSGRLEVVGADECECCDEPRTEVALRLDLALLTRDDDAAPGTGLRVPLGAFASRTHDLNRGFLQRSVEHANLCHQAELRRAVATRTDTRLGDIAGVHLADLHAGGVVLQWVDTAGAHEARLTFVRTASGPDDLGELLRGELHAGLC